MSYQPPVGVWASSPQRRLLWAVHGVLHRLEKEIPEQSHVDTWAATFAHELNDPVQSFDWEGWYAANVQKAKKPRWRRYTAGARVVSSRFLTVEEARAAARGFTRIRRDDRPELPSDLAAAWDGITAEVRTKLWPQAGEMRTKAEGLPFNPEDLDAGLDATFRTEVAGLTETTKDALRRMMKLALEEGEGQFGFARRLRSEFDAFSSAKAKQIAVTEWNRAASTATLEGYRKTGVQYKRWFTLGDNRVCPECEQNAADGEIPINDAFYDGNDAPPAHPGCRCSVSSA